MRSVHALLVLSAIVLLLFSAALVTGDEVSPRSDGPVYVIPIQGEIDQSLMVFLRRSIEKARSDNASQIIFEIDTFGGRVDSALQITTLIGSLSDISTAAYVSLRAEGTAVSWSAGALIAFSTDAIYMAPGTSMGSAAPIIQSPEGAVPADEKTVSALRTQMASLAEKNNYPRAIAVAMVDSDAEVLEVFLRDELKVLTRNEFETLLRTEPEDDVIEGPFISEKGKLLSLTAGDLEKYGVSSGTFSTIREVLDNLGAAEKRVVNLAPSTADQIVTIITGAAFTSVLILIGIIALFMEISSPGFGVPGAVAVLSFAMLFTGNALLGTVGSVELILFVLGIALIIVEIFLIPGFGVTGISGIALMILGLILSMQDFVIPTFTWQWDALGRNILLVVGNVVAGFIAFGVLAFLIPKYTPFRRLTLSLNQESSLGYTAQDASMESKYLGKSGTAVTVLRPSGKADIDGEVLQVETSGEYIEKDAEISVSAVNGNRIIVRRKR